MLKLTLGLGDAGHRLLDELEVVGDGTEILAHGGRSDLALQPSFGQPLLGELLTGLGNLIEYLGDQILEIQDLDALVAKDLGKGVVLLLSHLEEGNVIEKKTLELEGREIEKLITRAMQADLFELPYLARYM